MVLVHCEVARITGSVGEGEHASSAGGEVLDCIQDAIAIERPQVPLVHLTVTHLEDAFRGTLHE